MQQSTITLLLIAGVLLLLLVALFAGARVHKQKRARHAPVPLNITRLADGRRVTVPEAAKRVHFAPHVSVKEVHTEWQLRKAGLAHPEI